MEGLVVMLTIFGIFSGSRPDDLGLHEGRLRSCPSSPNCVSSEAGDDAHRIDAFRIRGEPAAAWRTLVEVVGAAPRTKVVTDENGYLHAECTSLLMGFVDDLELQLRADEGVVAVRSASRLGYGDLGANRRRVEELREQLRSRGVAD
jgi:uncharacterized protein (DUF1499 family)